MEENVKSLKNNSSDENRKLNLFKLILGTGMGLIFFVIPLKIGGKITIPFSFASKSVVSAISIFPAIVVLTTLISAIGALYFTLVNKKAGNDFLRELFVVTPAMLGIRVMAAVFCICVYFKVGHAYIYDSYTGGLVVNQLMPSLFVMFFFALAFLPLLLDFGAMELFGGVCKPIVKKLFKLPGMASILAIGGWIGGGTVAIISTDMEYQNGRFTAREASILVLGFCTISLPSTFVYTTAIGGLDVAHFSVFYLTVILCGIVSAAIIARIPPITKKPNAYINDKIAANVEESIGKPEEVEMGLDAAIKRAEKSPSLVKMIKTGGVKSIFMYIDACPIIIFTAILALVASEFTPIFKIMAIPFTPILEMIGLPEAAKAGPALIVGFVDLLLPFLAAGTITSQLTKFVVCAVGVIQIICLSETGAIVLKSKIPLSVIDLALVVIQKTIITIPIALLIGRLIGLN